MANQTIQNKRVLALSVGAVTDAAYLYAGADRSIASEMQGKDNGDTIYFKTTSLGDATISDVDANDDTTGTNGTLTANKVKHRQIPVRIKDAGIMFTVKALEKEITSLGGREDLAAAKIGGILAKKAVANIVADDLMSIGNVFVGDSTTTVPSDFSTIQKASAFMKSHVVGRLYDFMDWNIWGNLTAKGQQAVPCALANPRFGKDLEGSWCLIDEHRTTGDFPTFTGKSLTTINKVKIAKGSGDDAESVFIYGFNNATQASGTVPKGYMFTVAGVYSRDTQGRKTGKLFTFVVKSDITTQAAAGVKLTNENSNIGALGDPQDYIDDIGGSSAMMEGTALLTADTIYYAMEIRGERAQCFGTMDNCDCEGAKYEKSSIDGVTVHCNKGENVPGLKTDARYDMVFASKLVEPRAASLVLIKLG